MNYDALYEQRWLDGIVGIEVFVLYDDNHMTIYYSRRSESPLSNNNFLNSVMPEWRCYRYGGKTTEKGIAHLTRPKYTDRAMQYMFDACMFVKPKHSAESYEFGWNGFAAAHDDFNNALTDESVNIYQWRKQRPELQHMFDALKNKSECADFMSKILVLGAHVSSEEINEAYNFMIQHWRQRMEKLFNNLVWTDNLGLRLHHEICLAVELPRTGKDGRWNLMIHMISDELRAKYSSLLDGVENALTLDIQELRTQRHLAIRQSVNAWFETTSINKRINKCETTHGLESMHMYKKLYTHHLSQVMLHAVEHSISETIKTYEKQ